MIVMNGYITVREGHAASSSSWISVKYNHMFKYVLLKVSLLNIFKYLKHSEKSGYVRFQSPHLYNCIHWIIVLKLQKLPFLRN